MIKDKRSKVGLKLRTLICFIIIMSVFCSLLLPVPEGMNEKGLATVFIVILGIILWSTNMLPSAITGMVVIILFSVLGIIQFSDAAANLGKEIIWLLISMLIMSKAVEKTGLHKKVVYNLFLLAKGNIRLIILFIIIFLYIMTLFIPNIIGRVALIIPICINLINSFKKQNGIDIGKIVIPTITFVPVISAFSIVTGSGGTLYAVDLFESILGYHWGYLEWIKVMMPIGLITVILYWIVVVFFMFPSLTKVKSSMDSVYEERIKIGKITRQEIIVLLVYIILFTLWVTKEIHGYSLAMSAVLMLCVLFLPGINIISWKEAIQSVEWSIPFVFAAGFSIAQALSYSGVTNWFSILAFEYLKNLPVLIIVLILIFILMIIRLGFVNNTMMIAAFLPIIFGFATGTSINPLWLGMISLIASFICFMLPMQTISNMTTFSLGYHSFKDHLLLGIVMTLILILVTLTCAFFYWPLLGYKIYAF